MAKSKTFLFSILCTLVLLSNPVQGAVKTECDCCEEITVQTTLDVRSNIVSIASAEVGVAERTGNNDGERIMEYQSATGNHQGDQWCASFIAWAYKQAGLSKTGNAYSPTWFTTETTIYKPTKNLAEIPRHGDVFGVWVTSKNRVGHVGIIQTWGDKEVTTIEGNYSNSVSRVKRLTKQIYVAADWVTNQSTF